MRIRSSVKWHVYDNIALLTIGFVDLNIGMYVAVEISGRVE